MPDAGVEERSRSGEPYALYQGHPAHPTRLLARFKEGSTEAERLEVLGGAGLQVVHRDAATPAVAVLDTVKAGAPDTTTPAEARALGAALDRQIQTLMASGRFGYVEPDYEVHTCRTVTDDAFTDGSLWGLLNTGQDGGRPGVDVGAVGAWDLTAGDTDVVVAVIDTGIRYTHQDLAAQMWRNPGEIPNNHLDDDADGYVDDVFGVDAIGDSGDPMDQNGHGTHVAGTIGAQADGGGPHVGVAWNVRLMACRFLSASGGGYISDAIKCINFTIHHRARIINASWGGGGESQALFEAIARAQAAGILFVAAAGNDGRNTDAVPHYPSGYELENLLSVAALDRSGALAGFSNHGEQSADLAAPGVGIFSCTGSADAAYARLDGTSMAAPHVAGVAALVWSRFPDATVFEVKERLLRTTVPTSALALRTRTGGRVNAHLALALTFTGSPVLLSQPADVATPLGSTASFGVVVEATRPLSYQWHFNSQPVPSATNALLTLPEVQEGDQGTYEVVVTNTEGTIRSEPATLTLLPALPITTFAGVLAFPGHADGTGRAARFNSPMGVAADPNGNLLIADFENGVIRTVSPDRRATTLAGAPGMYGWQDGVGATARFARPCGVAVDPMGNVYVADYGASTVRKITPGGEVSTLAGKAGESGGADGSRATARFKMPRAVAVGLDGTVFVADSDNHAIRRITPEGMVSTWAGAVGEGGNGDGPGHLARFSLPTAIALDAHGNLWVADTGNSTIRKITATGWVSTAAGWLASWAPRMASGAGRGSLSPKASPLIVKERSSSRIPARTRCGGSPPMAPPPRWRVAPDGRAVRMAPGVTMSSGFPEGSPSTRRVTCS